MTHDEDLIAWGYALRQRESWWRRTFRSIRDWFYGTMWHIGWLRNWRLRRFARRGDSVARALLALLESEAKRNKK